MTLTDCIIVATFLIHTLLGYRASNYIFYSLEIDSWMDSVLQKTGINVRQNKTAFIAIFISCGLLYVSWPLLFIMSYAVNYLERKNSK